MLDEFTVPYFLDSRPLFQIDYDEDKGIFDAYACSKSQREWVWVDSSRDFNELHRRCTAGGMSYDGATEGALLVSRQAPY